MGNFVSNNSFFLLVKRATTRYNVVNRAHKELERQRNIPKAAPKHDAGIIDYRKSMLANREYLDETENKNVKLDEHLKDVFVSSDGIIPNIQKESKDRPLPLSRTSEDFPFGFKDPKFIPLGKVSLIQSMQFIHDHQSNAHEWTTEKIADKYKLKPYVVDDILKYYFYHEVHVPTTANKPTIGEREMKKLS